MSLTLILCLLKQQIELHYFVTSIFGNFSIQHNNTQANKIETYK